MFIALFAMVLSFVPGYFKFTILTDYRTTQSLRNCFSQGEWFVI